MKSIVLFGAGKSSSVLINYLKQLAVEKNWHLTVADNNLQAAKEKVGHHALVKAVKINIENDQQRKQLVQQADVVISLMPPSLHYLLALDCILFHKHLLTASYVDDKLQQLSADIEHRNLLFLCEMGLDPGIDHMSAMQMIHRIQQQKGIITSFKSYCGGLVAPESDDNPWHYKISWNPRNIILAGKAGALYKMNKKEIQVDYKDLFDNKNLVDIPELGVYAYYPNRDSLHYINLYNLHSAQTFIRTTLRHPDYCYGWKNIIELNLTDEDKIYDTEGLSIADFFKIHFEKNGFTNWLNDVLMSRFNYANDVMQQLTQLIQSEEISEQEPAENKDVMVVNEKGELTSIGADTVKDKAAESVAGKMHEADLTLKQLLYLGLDDETLINKGTCSAADVMQFIMETRLGLKRDDKDMIVMMHEIQYTKGKKKHKTGSYLIVKGENNVHTAMAKTVGLPLGIAAKLLLEGKLTDRGLQIPTLQSIYEPVLKELEQQGIKFIEY